MDTFGTIENGPWGAQGASETAISGHMWKYLSIGSLRYPICVEHLLNKVEHCILQMKGPVAPLLTHQKWFRGVSGGPKTAISGHIRQYLTIGGPCCPIWVEHRLNKIEHCSSHLRELVGPLRTHRIWSCGVPEGPKTPKIVHYRGYLAIFCPI